MNKITAEELRVEIQRPQTKLGRRYLAVVISAIIISVFFLFLQQEHPNFASAGSLNEFIIELFLLIIFSFDFIIRLLVIQKKPIDIIFISVDFLAIIPSLIAVLCYFEIVQQSDL